jgi:hypothetical protein
MDLTWGYPQGEFAMLNKDHIIELTSYGPNLVRNGEIRIPGNRVNYIYSGQNPDIRFVSTGQLVREPTETETTTTSTQTGTTTSPTQTGTTTTPTQTGTTTSATPTDGLPNYLVLLTFAAGSPLPSGRG